jgi:hypothetical protein
MEPADPAHRHGRVVRRTDPRGGGLATGAFLGSILSTQLDNAVKDAANRAGVQLIGKPGGFTGTGTAADTLRDGRNLLRCSARRPVGERDRRCLFLR